MQSWKYHTIGTSLIISLKTDSNAESVFKKIQDFLEGFDMQFSRFRENNWLHDFNVHNVWMLDEHSKTMIEYIKTIAGNSWGYFDPTIGKRLRELGYGNTWVQTTAWEFIHADFESIFCIDGMKLSKKPGFDLEFWGVGKGYCIDVIKNILIEAFANTEFLINFWGDMAGVWRWKIALESPFKADEAIGIYTLTNSFLACSSPSRRQWNGHHHLINPFTWESSREVIAVFLETPLATPQWGMFTDSYATTLSVMPFTEAKKLLEITENLEGILIRNDGTFYKTPYTHLELFI